jgi:phosphate transport system ATP-binding protein
MMEKASCCAAEHAACCRPPVMVAARGLSVRYGGRLTLEGVDLDLRRNRILAIIGPSGCGKSTFLATLNRLCDMIPGCHVGGHVAVDGADIRDGQADVRLLRCKVGMIFQKPNPFPLSIRRNIDMPLKEHGVCSAKEREIRMEEALTEVGLWREVRDRLGEPALSLSGGQQQRLCIARALALQPEVVLMDEPCSALDPMSSAVIEDLIVKMKQRYTIAIVTHNLAQARRIADDVAIFWTVDGVGRVIEQGPAELVFAAPADPISASYLSGARG